MRTGYEDATQVIRTQVVTRDSLRILGCTCLAVFTCLTQPTYPVFAQMMKAENAGMRFDDSLVDAADKGNIRAVMSLVQSGKFVDSRGRFDSTPLMRAAFNQHKEVLAFLLSKGANPDLKDVGGATALHIAARRGNTEAITALLQAGAEPNVQDKEGWSPLMRAAIEGNSEGVKALLSHNASPSLVNIMGESALMHAVFAGDAKSAQLLVNYGADMRHKDENGLTAADIAYQRGFDAVLEVLAAPPVAADPLPPRPTIRSNLPERQDTPPAALPKPLSAIPAPSAEPARTMPEKVASLAPANAPSNEARETTTSSDDLTLPPELSSSKPSKKITEASGSVPAPRKGFGFTPLPTLDDTYHAPSREEEEPSQSQPATPAQAAAADDSIMHQRPTTGTHYLLQLGTFPSQREAREHWNALTSAQPELLGSTEMVISEAALRTNNRTVFRTQAGYFTSRRAADQLCSTLFEQKIDCFVVESTGGDTGDKELAALGATPPESLLPSPAQSFESAPSEARALSEPPAFAGVRESASVSQEADTDDVPPLSDDASQENSPWRILRDTKPDMPDSHALPAPLPTLEEDDRTTASTPPETVEKPAHAAPVQPATAMDLASLPARSSFSSDMPPPATPQEKVTPLTPEKPAELASLPPAEEAALPENIALPSQDEGRTSSWLQLSSFPGEQQAREFWDGLLVTQPALSNGLRFRVTQPFQMRGIGPVAVRVGPITSQEQLNGLCAFAKERKILCRTVSDIGASSTANMARYRGDDAAVQPPASPPQTLASPQTLSSPMMAAAGGTFWVMLGSYPDRARAEQEWKLLRDIHADVLPKYTPDISTPRLSSSSTQILRLRVGPFIEQRQALQLCSALQRRGTRCLTLRD